MFFRARAVLLAAVIGASAASANTLPPLSENDYINDRLFAAAVGDVIRKTCPTIAARLFYVFRKARDLENFALAQGYSEAEIDAYTSSPAEKQKMKERRDAYLKAKGAENGNKESYCRVGNAEIDQKSLIGSLLRKR